MIETAFLERIAEDIANRSTSCEVNGQPVAIKSITVQNTRVTVLTEQVSGVHQITSLVLLDELGNVIVRRTPNVTIVDQRSEFRFEFEVKGE